MPVAVHGISGSMEVVSMDWYSGSAPPNRPVLAICYRNGLIIMMKNCIEEGKLALSNWNIFLIFITLWRLNLCHLIMNT